MYIDKLDDTVNKYNNAYHIFTLMLKVMKEIPNLKLMFM